MDVTSSLITVIASALTATKAIYSTVSKINDAPQHVQQAVTELRQLQSIFARLQSLQPSVDRRPDLRELINEYIRGLRSFKAIIYRLEAMPGDSRGRRFWKSVRLAFRDGDMDRMYRFVQHHFNALSTHLAIIERFVINQIAGYHDNDAL